MMKSTCSKNRNVSQSYGTTDSLVAARTFELVPTTCCRQVAKATVTSLKNREGEIPIWASPSHLESFAPKMAAEPIIETPEETMKGEVQLQKSKSFGTTDLKFAARTFGSVPTLKDREGKIQNLIFSSCSMFFAPTKTEPTVGEYEERIMGGGFQ